MCSLCLFPFLLLGGIFPPTLGQSMVHPSTTTPQHVQASMPTHGYVGEPSMPTSSHDQVLHRQSGLDGSLRTPTNKQELLLVNHLISTTQLIPFVGTTTKTGPAVNIKFVYGI